MCMYSMSRRQEYAPKRQLGGLAWDARVCQEICLKGIVTGIGSGKPGYQWPRGHRPTSHHGPVCRSSYAWDQDDTTLEYPASLKTFTRLINGDRATAVSRPSRHRRRRRKKEKGSDSLGRHPRLGCCTLLSVPWNCYRRNWMLSCRGGHNKPRVMCLAANASGRGENESFWRRTRQHTAPSHSASNLSCMCAQPAHRHILHSAAPWCPQAPCLHMGMSDTFCLWPAACHGHSYLHPLRRCKEFAAPQAYPALACCFCTWAVKVKVWSRAPANCRHALALLTSPVSTQHSTQPLQLRVCVLLLCGCAYHHARPPLPSPPPPSPWTHKAGTGPESYGRRCVRVLLPPPPLLLGSCSCCTYLYSPTTHRRRLRHASTFAQLQLSGIHVLRTPPAPPSAHPSIHPREVYFGHVDVGYMALAPHPKLPSTYQEPLCSAVVCTLYFPRLPSPEVSPAVPTVCTCYAHPP
ncbi:hypothetical protein COCMIDRAFT_28360 [Bipolaris oryzae ATCC 44560]|uniref:Uncharacterized protein n=1 Tax=Bipolaris oryzae ATCC 44560 TaxID=930090 RepID=W6Z6K8_COCMI|nr:uncharacterized protein COCMIDRAFT_28360 [Bipolaris oryzae ATCC 44560]EUC43159.1 hypothetical protein COCMIDRAFT_28360 [Bipolaris oryzae ATCC 44560]